MKLTNDEFVDKLKDDIKNAVDKVYDNLSQEEKDRIYDIEMAINIHCVPTKEETTQKEEENHEWKKELEEKAKEDPFFEAFLKFVNTTEEMRDTLKARQMEFERELQNTHSCDMVDKALESFDPSQEYDGFVVPLKYTAQAFVRLDTKSIPDTIRFIHEHKDMFNELIGKIDETAVHNSLKMPTPKEIKTLTALYEDDKLIKDRIINVHTIYVDENDRDFDFLN